MPLKRRWITLLAPLLLFSCIFVDDFGVYWDKGTVDTKLSGSWSAREECVSFTADKNVMHFTDGDGKDSPARVLTLGNATFLMVKAGGKGKDYLMRYALNGDRWVIYIPNEKKREDFLKHYATANFMVDEHSVTIHTLDAKTAALLEKLAGMEDYWSVTDTYQRIASCGGVHE